jgi:hypothetical protein
MTRKLTLSINEKTIQKAKRISRRRGKSISKMVEEYLNNIVEKENKSDPIEEIMEIMKKHTSKVPLPADGNYNKMVNEWRYEEYMKKSKSKRRK